MNSFTCESTVQCQQIGADMVGGVMGGVPIVLLLVLGWLLLKTFTGGLAPGRY